MICCIPFFCKRSDIPASEQFKSTTQTYVDSHIYEGDKAEWSSSDWYRSKAIEGIGHDKIKKTFEEKPVLWAARDITALRWNKANNLADLQPGFVLERLKVMYNKNKASKPEEGFFDKISPENACKIILFGIQRELDNIDDPGTFLRANSTTTRLLAVFFSRNQSFQNQDAINNLVKKIPDQILISELEEMRLVVDEMLAMLSFMVNEENLDAYAWGLLVEMYKLVEKKGKGNETFKDQGQMLSFGQFILRYLNPAIVCIESSDNDEQNLVYSHKQTNAKHLATIFQLLNANLDEEKLKEKIVNEQEQLLIELVLEFQEVYNKIRNSLFPTKAIAS